MITPYRLPACAAICILAAVGTAAAQTVFVRHAPTGRTIDVLVGRTDAGKGAADDNGDAKIPIDLSRPWASPKSTPSFMWTCART
jgi:hypothetical protein